MDFSFSLALILLFFCKGESSEQVLAFEGGDVILPCSFNITANGDFPNVEWSKEGLEPNVVFLYRDGCETVEMKNPVFEYRTSLIPKELQNGNISLRISNLQLSDAGRYLCMQLWKNAPRDVIPVELVVGAVSEPHLSVISAECGGVTLQCEANSSLPEPEIIFLDDQGNKIPAEDQKRDEEARGYYTVRRRMTLQTATNSVTCRAQQLDFNLVRDTEILIPADSMTFCFLTIVICVGGTIFVSVFVCGLAFWLFRKFGKSAEGQKWVLDQSDLSVTIEKSPLEQSNRADSSDNVGNRAIEILQREVAHLKLQLHQRNETIQQLLNPGVFQHKQPSISCSASSFSLDSTKPLFPPFIQSLDTSINDRIPKPTVSSNNNLPKSDSLHQNMGPKPDTQRQNCKPAAGQKIRRRNSSPAGLSPELCYFFSASGSKKNLETLGHSAGESYAKPAPKPDRSRRRHSLGISSTLSTNRYSILTDVEEESEPLMS